MDISSSSAFSLGGYIGVIVSLCVILVATFVVGKIATRILRKVLKEATDGQVGGSILKNILLFAIWAIGIGLAAKWCFGFDLTVIWGALGIGGIALSLGLQSTISDLIGGLQMSLNPEVGVGDYVTLGNGISGEVKDIDWRSITVEDELGNKSLVPNNVFRSTAVTVLTDYQCVTTPLVLSRTCDVDRVKRELPQIVMDALVQKDMNFENKMPSLVLSGVEMAGLSGKLFSYVKRSFTTSAVNNVAMSAALDYLRENDALGSIEA